VCSSKDPCFEHTNGKQYHIAIVERWQSPPASLSRIFGEGTGYVDAGCIQPPTGWSSCNDDFVVEIQEL
jgi:hypothetical protein